MRIHIIAAIETSPAIADKVACWWATNLRYHSAPQAALHPTTDYFHGAAVALSCLGYGPLAQELFFLSELAVAIRELDSCPNP